MHSEGKTAPWWTATLLAAKDWGVPPWTLTNQEPNALVRMRWLERRSVLSEQLAKKNNPNG